MSSNYRVGRRPVMRAMHDKNLDLVTALLAGATLGTPSGLVGLEEGEKFDREYLRFLRFANKVLTQPTGLLRTVLAMPRI